MLVDASRRSRTIGGILLLAASATFIYLSAPSGSSIESFSWHQRQAAITPFRHGPGAGNDTLGFGAIYVLTENTTTWRVQGLIRAANCTGLQLQIPIQNHLSDEDVEARIGHHPAEGYGHARALLNHLSLLETFSKSTHETAPILEDDVGFGIHIRSQMSLISEAFWNHSKRTPETPGDQDLHPYLESTWDIFWPGHFGMQFADGADVFRYTDPYALPWKHLTSEFNNYYTQMAFEEGPAQQQLVFNSAPLATFAYAITRSHASQLVEKFRRDRVSKFDNALHIDWKGLAQRCVAPVPQVFHHHQVAGEKSLSSEEGRREEVAKDLEWYIRRHKWTYNIDWSARCNALEVGERLEKGWSCGPGKYDEMM